MNGQAPSAGQLQLDVRRFGAVIFDMDGVITDTATVHAIAWKRTFDRFLVARAPRQCPFEPSDYYRYVDGKPREQGVASFLASRGIMLPSGTPEAAPGEGSVWAIANLENREFERIISESGVKAFPSSVPLVRRLQAVGLGTAIISGSRNCQRILAAAGVENLFAVRVDGMETARLGLAGKPDPAVFLEASRQLGLPPDRVVVVEDARAGVAAGRKGGFGLVVGIDRRHGQRQELLAHGADVVVEDLGEVELIGLEGLEGLDGLDGPGAPAVGRPC